eukprot:gene25641-30971_t
MSLSVRTSTIWLFYTIQDPWEPSSSSATRTSKHLDSFPNVLAIPYSDLVSGNRREALLVDLLLYVTKNSLLKRVFQQLRCSSLPSLLSPLPIQPDGTLHLQLISCGHGLLPCASTVSPLPSDSSLLSSTASSASYTSTAAVTNADVHPTASTGPAILSSLASLAQGALANVLELVPGSSGTLDLRRHTHLSSSHLLDVGHSRVRVLGALAEGAFGSVFRVSYEGLSKEAKELAAMEGLAEVEARERGAQLALKQLVCRDSEQVDDAHRELQVLRDLPPHPHLPSLLDHASLRMASQGQGTGNSAIRQVLLLLPLYSSSCQDLLLSAGPFAVGRALRVCAEVASALQHMHAHGLVHGDVKPQNIMLTHAGSAALVDLGSALAVPVHVETRRQALQLEEQAARTCSLPYRPPELLQVPTGVVLDGQIDVWSLGCALYALLCGHSPFEQGGGVQRLGILNGSFPAPRIADTSSSPQALQQTQQLLRDMLVVDAQQRLHMEETYGTSLPARSLCHGVCAKPTKPVSFCDSDSDSRLVRYVDRRLRNLRTGWMLPGRSGQTRPQFPVVS